MSMFLTTGASLESRTRALEDTLAKVLVRLAHLEQNSSPSQIAAETIPFPPNEVRDGPYAYRALDGKTKEIRILAVYSSAKEEDDIICELVYASLDWDGDGIEQEEMAVAWKALTTFNTLSYTVRETAHYLSSSSAPEILERSGSLLSHS
jgi:hypothetical protein